MTAIVSRDDTYQARYAWLNHDGAMFAISTIMMLGSLALYREPLYMGAGLLFFGAGVVMFGPKFFLSPPPLDIDSQGISIHGHPAIAWRDMTGIEIAVDEPRGVASLTIGHWTVDVIEADELDEDFYREAGRYPRLTSSTAYLGDARFRLARFREVVSHHALGLPVTENTPA
jgi:hypothetical protein